MKPKSHLILCALQAILYPILKTRRFGPSLSDGMDTAIEDPTILLDQYHLPRDGYLALVAGILVGTASIVSDGSFNLESLIGPVGTSTVVLAPST